MLAQGRSAVLSFTVDVKKSDSSFRNNQSKRCLSKERCLVIGHCFFAHTRQERFKTFPVNGICNTFKAKAKTGRAT
jgi:hypothetical protein